MNELPYTPINADECFKDWMAESNMKITSGISGITLNPLQKKMSHSIMISCGNQVKEVKNEKSKTDIHYYKCDVKTALENYNFWQGLNRRHGNENIFKDTTECDFLLMIFLADFSRLKMKKVSKHIKYNIAVLSRIEDLGKEWGEAAAKSIGTDLESCRKNAPFEKYSTLKDMYKKSPPP